jgi:hypothetical protein
MFSHIMEKIQQRPTYIFHDAIGFGIMNGASHADQRDISIRFVLYTESKGVLLSVYNVLCTVELDIECTEWLNDARPKVLVSGNEAVTMTSGSDSGVSPLLAENDR